ncbi:hypothetical protein CY35_02G128300 [Sphagnum magellanicum]|nr:hypothetical protein CY35_02G128300 [Sphagnum magellanicum]
MNTMEGWFERDVQSGHFKLRKKYEEGVVAQKAKVQKGKSGSRGIFKDHPQAFDMILSTLKGMRDVGQPMDANVAQTVILGIVQALAPELLLKRTGRGGEVVSSLQKVLSEVFEPLPGVDVEKSHHGCQQAARRLGATGG